MEITVGRARSAHDVGEAWTTADATELYEIARWGRDYFSIGDNGQVRVHPSKDPKRSIDLKQLVDENDGRLVPAIAAYNAGPGALARWKQRAAGRGGDEFIELISYRETKGYVKAVLRNYRAYRAIAGQSAATAPKLY